MNGRVVLFVLSNLLLVLGACLLAPLSVAFGSLDQNPAWELEVLAIGGTAVVAGTAGLVGRRVFSADMDKIGVREGFAIVTFTWLAAVGVGMLPYLLSGTCDSITDAFFETMSGFTTTGATIFEQVEVIPRGVQFWRCMTQWLGGMGIVVLSIALLPMLGAGGYRMLKAESPGGVAFERERPRITDTAKELWRLYVIISAGELVLLLIAGMDVFDAFCHTFTTMSTGGFSPHSESIAYFDSPFVQWIIVFFMFAAGVNFSLYSQLQHRRWRSILRNPELRLYLIILISCTALGVAVVKAAPSVEEQLRSVAFQIVSIATTTGFATADYDVWPWVMRGLLLLLMFIGGCMGSTAGGMKVARLLIFGKSVVRELHRPIYPHAVKPIRVGYKVIDPSLVSNIMTFGTLFAMTFVVGALTMAACGYDLVTSMSASAAAVGNIGPGLGEVGPTKTWSHLPAVAKWVMSFIMLAGRLELYSVLILLTPWVWRR